MHAFGRASNYTLVARGHLVEVLMELGQPVSSQSMLPLSSIGCAFLMPFALLPVPLPMPFGVAVGATLAQALTVPPQLVTHCLTHSLTHPTTYCNTLYALAYSPSHPPTFYCTHSAFYTLTYSCMPCQHSTACIHTQAYVSHYDWLAGNCRGVAARCSQ